MNKISLLIIIFLFFNNCSSNKDTSELNEKKTNLQKKNAVKGTLIKQEKNVQEFNSKLIVNVSSGELNENSDNNQNDIGELNYKGILEKLGNYSYSGFNDFNYIEAKPIFHNEDLIFFDNKGTIIFYDQNQKIMWKKNFYSKSEKKNTPRLNLAIKKNILIVTDDIAKYYAIDLKTNEIKWEKRNIVPFNSDIKVNNNTFYIVDYKNILRAISIKDGSEIWNLKTEESITKSNTKLSIAIDKENVYFNNSIGDITAVNIKSGLLLWQLPTQNSNISQNAFQLSSSKLVVNDNSILFSNNKSEFYSIDVKTGLINWKQEINSILRPIVIGRYIITISSNGYLHLINKKSGDIIRINDLYKNYSLKKRSNVFPTGFVVANNKIYLTNNDGKLIIADLSSGDVLSMNKISGNKILQPYVDNNNLFLIKNGSIIKFN